MRQSFIIILFALGLLTSYAYAEDCRAYIGTCEYYLCRENNKQCGVKGYFLGFGYKYCQSSIKKLMNKVSPEGRDWLTETSICLQEQSEEISNDNSCAEIKRQSIEGHDLCYQQSDFCSLRASDKRKIIRELLPALKVKGVLREGFQILNSCRKK